MKAIAVALVVMLVGANALPSEFQTTEVKKTRIADDLIRGILEGLIEVAAAADPYVVSSASGAYTFPVPGVFTAVASVENFKASGYGNIEIVDVSLTGSLLRVELLLAGVEVSADSATAEVTVFSRTITGAISGSFAITDVRVAVEAELGLTGYLLNDLALDFSIGGINSNLNIRINERDLSNTINNWFNVTLPATLEKYGEQLNRLIASLILRVLERIF